MKKKTMRIKRISLILIIIFISGVIMPLFGADALVVKAAGQEPSVRYFAEQKQLMDGSLNMGTKDAGEKGTVGYINFGKDENGNARRWYVIGNDAENANKTNVILFACKDVKNAYFWDCGQTVTADNLDSISRVRDFPNGVKAEGVEYEDGSDPKSVYVNNYGVSDLRKTFKDVAKDTRYFTEAEQKLMLSTVVSNTSLDERDNVKYYTVEDKFYAPMADSAKKLLLFGSGKDKTKMVEAYPTGDLAMFAWTRTPLSYNWDQVYVWNSTNQELDGSNTIVFFVYEGFHPAFALDLTNVLFASAAPTSSAGGEEIKPPRAMNLRMKDDGSRLKGVTLGYTKSEITYAADSNIYLVVQGKTEDGKDWYYSTLANTGGKKSTLDWDMVNTGLGSVDIGAEASFDTCKVWMEMTDTDGFTYAVSGKRMPDQPTEIDNVIITGIDVPDPETKTFDKTAKCETEGVLPSAPSVSWTQDGKEVTEPEYEQTYTASLTLKADTNYKFADNVTATVNGHKAKASLDADTGILTVSYDFKVGEDLPKIEFEVDAFSGKYDGEPHTVTVTPTDPADADVYYGVMGEDGKVVYGREGVAPEYVNAGKYTVYIRIEKDGFTPVEDYITTITISKRHLRIKVKNQRVEWESKLPIAQDKYEVTGDLLQGDEVVKVTLKANPAGLKAGKTGWITVYNGDVKIENRDGDDVSDNYIIEGVPGELTVVHNPDLPPTAITVKKEKTEYKTGETLDVDDLEVTVSYEDGYTEKVTDYTTNADKINMSRPGEKKLIVTYEGQEREVLITVQGETDNDNSSNTNGGNNKPDDTSGNGTSGSTGNNSASGSSGSGTSGSSGGSSSGSSNSQTGDMAPLTQWSFTAICSEAAILCVLLYYLSKSGKKKK